jgi:predicted methyltransferase
MPGVRRFREFAALWSSATIVIAGAAWGTAQEPGSATATATATATPSAGKVDPKINEAFKSPNVRSYIKKFETDSREVYAKRREIVAALDLASGMSVADIGAGTGVFTRLIAEKVGPTGRVYAVDIAQAFIAHIAAEAKKRRQHQIVTVLGSQDSTNLSAESVDLVFLSDVYHHLEKPEKTLASIYRSLRPGGGLVVVDFDRVEGRSPAFVLKHVRASQAVFAREIEQAGFTRVSAANAPRLNENFFLKFRKADRLGNSGQ